MKIVLIGADGQLAKEIVKVFGKEEIIPLTRKELDIVDPEKTFAVIKKESPQVIINTAAYHRVDDCEDHDQEAFEVNVLGVKHLALAAKEIGAALLHVSSDYVFGGDKKTPYVESDVPNPKTAYGISKLAGEFYLKYLLPEHYIVRTSGIFGIAGCRASGGLNFIELMLKLAREKGDVKVVTDQIVSPTYAPDLAGKIKELIATKKYGTYHITNDGECSWYDFAKEIFTLTNTKVNLMPTTTATFPTKAKRPAYSVLKNQALGEIGLKDLRDWKEGLKAYFSAKDEGSISPRLS